MAKRSTKPIVRAELETSAPEGYISILDTIVGKIKAAQTRAMMAVNHELIAVYRDIGRTIYEQQQGSGWGTQWWISLLRICKIPFQV